MAKNDCVVCNKKLGMMTVKSKIQDGVVCTACLFSSGIHTFDNGSSYNAVSLNEYIKHRAPQLFHPLTLLKLLQAL